MKKLMVILALAVFAFAPASPSRAVPREDKTARGNINLTVHTHSSEFRGPGGAPLLVEETDPLSFDFSEGEDFSYSSVACEDPAPFNDVALNFNPDYPGIEDPAAVRHIVEGEITEVQEDEGTIEGTITTFLCENGEEGDAIFFEFSGDFVRASDNELRVRGTFQIVGGTGMFAEMTGQGSIMGHLTCLAGVLENVEADSCAELGVFSDAVFRLRGTYEDPTV